MTEQQINEVMDYVFRCEQSGIHAPETDWEYLRLVAGELNRMRTESETMAEAIDRILDIAASV